MMTSVIPGKKNTAKNDNVVMVMIHTVLLNHCDNVIDEAAEVRCWCQVAKLQMLAGSGGQPL